MNRRNFFKVASTSAIALSGCNNKQQTVSSPESNYTGEIPTDKMTYRTTPTTGDKVSLLGYGCMRWPMKKKSDGSNSDEIDQEAVNELVDYAIAHGVNYFDMAPVYLQGKCETATGIALKRHPRESYYVATKMSNHRLAGKGLSPQETFKQSVEMYHDSFKNIQTDYIDYYLLHSIGGGDGLNTLNERYFDNGLLDFLLREREAGRIRNLGFSFHGDQKVFDYMLAHNDEFHWDFVQIQFNYLDYGNASGRNVKGEYLYNELEKLNIPAVIMEPLLGGRLSKMSDHLVARLKQRRPENSVASWAFRFAGSFPNILTVLSGMTYMEHLQDNIRTYAPLEYLTDEEKDFLYDTAKMILQYPLIACNDCKYCMPCPYGIDIPGVMLHYNKCVNEGNTPNDKQDAGYRKARQAFLVGYDRSVPKLRQASHCTACGQCNPLCPQRIDIPKELQKIDKYVEQLKKQG